VLIDIDLSYMYNTYSLKCFIAIFHVFTVNLNFASLIGLGLTKICVSNLSIGRNSNISICYILELIIIANKVHFPRTEFQISAQRNDVRILTIQVYGICLYICKWPNINSLLNVDMAIDLKPKMINEVFNRKYEWIPFLCGSIYFCAFVSQYAFTLFEV
jgi:hypothetical protein